MENTARSFLRFVTAPLAAILLMGSAICTLAQRPVITSFESDGTLTWSNAYPDGDAWIEQLTDVVTTGASVTVTEMLGTSDGFTAVYSYTVEHPPIVHPSVTISDGTYSWNDVTLSSSPTDFTAVVGDHESGQVSAVYLSGSATSGTVIEVEYSYLPLSTTRKWLAVYSEQLNATLMQAQLSLTSADAWFRAVNGVPPGMVLIPGGTDSGTNPLGVFYSPESHDCFYPATYSLSVGSFYMDRYLVTKALWDEVANWAASHGYDISAGGGAGKAPDHPVHYVSWYSCVKWCNARSEMEDRAPAYYTSASHTMVYRTGSVDVEEAWMHGDTGYRLPTTEEWEYAARGGLTGKRFPWGDTASHSEANYRGVADSCSYDLNEGHHQSYNSGDMPYTNPVGAFEPNAHGLYDMMGNLLDWCQDWDGCGRSGRSVRGGSWDHRAPNCRIGDREHYGSPGGNGGFHIGFRTVLPAVQ